MSDPARFELRTSAGRTRVAVGPRALDFLRPEIGERRAVLVADRRLLALHGDRVRRKLGVSLRGEIALASGEAAKTVVSAARVWARLARLGVGRGDVLVALGGGAALDATGFVASTWMRGMAWIAIPTTLLAQADACLGGKTALDLPQGKNLIGTFHPPEAALADPAVLGTLPEHEFHAALFELLKCAWLGDAALGRLVLGRALSAREPAAVAEAVWRALKLKARLVASDLRDHGPRRLLNLGHTFGHAIEAAGGFRALRHGEAVGIGLLAAAKLARRRGLLDEAAFARYRDEVTSLRLPRLTAGLLPRAMAAARLDKKREPNRRGRALVVVLPTGKGAVVVAGISTAEFRRALGDALALLA